tara:strand:- start:1078 stop:1440 length:363 start_codon:yes stop_codon:yes gene_type:complete
MENICSGFPCNEFEVGGYLENQDIDDYNTEEDKAKFIHCRKICEKEYNGSEIDRKTDNDDKFRTLSSDLHKRKNEMLTTDKFVKDTTQLWRFEKNKFIFLIICLILISLCALYMVYKNTQ